MLRWENGYWKVFDRPSASMGERLLEGVGRRNPKKHEILRCKSIARLPQEAAKGSVWEADCDQAHTVRDDETGEFHEPGWERAVDFMCLGDKEGGAEEQRGWKERVAERNAKDARIANLRPASARLCDISRLAKGE